MQMEKDFVSSLTLQCYLLVVSIMGMLWFVCRSARTTDYVETEGHFQEVVLSSHRFQMVNIF